MATGENGKYKWGELLKEDGKNAIDPMKSATSLPDGYNWTAIATPGGQTDDQFSGSVAGSYRRIGTELNGKRYSSSGEVNSNMFAFRVINESGGSMPSSVVPTRVVSPYIPFLRGLQTATPGICGPGGGRFGNGNHCTP